MRLNAEVGVEVLASALVSDSMPMLVLALLLHLHLVSELGSTKVDPGKTKRSESRQRVADSLLVAAYLHSILGVVL